MHNLIFCTLFAILSLNSHAIDINKACTELIEQKKALLSILSTSLTEANMAGQCIGYQAVRNKTRLSIDKACAEYIEQRKSAGQSKYFIERSQRSWPMYGSNLCCLRACRFQSICSKNRQSWRIKGQ